MEFDEFKPVFPTLGEILREASYLLGSKPIITNDTPDSHLRLPANLNRLAREGDFDYSQIDPIKRVIFKAPFFTPDPMFEKYLSKMGDLLVTAYINMIKYITLAGFGRKESIPWLIEHKAAHFIYRLILYRQKTYSDRVKTLNLLKDDNPMRSFFLWLEDSYPEWHTFYKTFGQTAEYRTKTERDKVGKWKNNIDIPSTESLWNDQTGMFSTFYSICQIERKSQNIINESLLFARMLQLYYRRSASAACLRNLQQMAAKQYKYLSDYDKLMSYKTIPIDVIDKKVYKYLVLCDKIQKRLIMKPSRGASDKLEIYEMITSAEEEAILIKDYNPHWWQIKRFHGMWHVFNKDFERAIPFYVHAVQGASYSGSENSEKIWGEALALCSALYINGVKKVNGKNLKSYIQSQKGKGIVFGYKTSSVPEEVDAFKFKLYFPNELYFPQDL